MLGEGQLNLHQIYDSPATNLPASDFALPQPVPQVNRAHRGAKCYILLWVEAKSKS